MTKQARRPGEQCEPTENVDGETEVAQGCTTCAGTVERQRPPEDAWMRPADRLEQAKVRPELALLGGDPQQDRCSGVTVLVQSVTEPGNVSAGGTLGADGFGGQ